MSAAHYGAYAHLGRMTGDDAINAMLNKLRELDIDVSEKEVKTNLEGFFVEFELWFQQLANDKGYSDYVKILNDKTDYVLRIFPATRGIIVLRRTNGTFPFSDVIPSKTSKKQLFELIQVAMTAAGIKNVKESENQKVEQVLEIDAEPVDSLFTINDKTLAGGFKKHTIVIGENESYNNQYYKVVIGYEIKTIGDSFDYEVQIRPYYQIQMKKEVVEALVETDQESAIPYLLSVYGKTIAGGSKKVTLKSLSDNRVVDPRKTYEKLAATIRTHGNIKPRVNKDGFAISTNGLPIYIPQANLTNEYMTALTSAKKDDDGHYNFSEKTNDWANKLIMVDWFNDVMVFTDTSGQLEVDRMLGFVQLDVASEYMFMNASIAEPGFKEVFFSLTRNVDKYVDLSEIEGFLPKNPQIALKTSDKFGVLASEYLIKSLNAPFNAKDSSVQYHTKQLVCFKHLLGVDLDELAGNDGILRACYITQAYLKAFAKKRSKIEMPVRERLEGIEYLLATSQKTQENFDKLREAAQTERNKNKPQRLLKEIDLPNLDAGGNLKGWLPHQVRVVSNMMSLPNSSAHEVATGGGKSILSLAALLIKKQQSPKSRALIITKSRLVKNTISEINFFSNGKLNGFPFRAKTLRLMRKRVKIDTAKKLFEYLNKLPDNTIYVSGYTDFVSRSKIYKDLDLPEGILTEDIALTQFLHIARMLNFEIVFADESHMIKNFNSSRSIASYSAMSYATNKSIASGTINSNSIVDMIGQGFALNPMIYTGKQATFMDKFALESVTIKDDEQAASIRNRLLSFSQVNRAYKEDWAFVNPDLKEDLLKARATPLQTEYYNKLLEEAELVLRDMQKNKKIKGGGKDPSQMGLDDTKQNATNTSPDDDEDDSGDNEEDDLTADDFEDTPDGEDEFLIAAAQVSLSKAEMFLLAPDTNQDYLAWEKRPTGNDLVSVGVAAIDRKLDAIFSDPNADYSKNKAALFGIHKVVSKHFFQHSRWKSRMIHYTAGDEEAVRKFKTDKNIWILCADSTSLREGENLQLLTNILTLQSPWASGDDEQLKSRMYRPDPKGVFNKDMVYQTWLQIERADGNPGINQIKFARMISKAISIGRFKHGDNPLWKQVSERLDNLPLIKMSLDFLFKSSQQDLSDYMDAHEIFTSWERSLNKVSREKLAQEIERDNPGIKLLDGAGKVIDRALFTKLAMREAKSSTNLPGSRKAFVPWEYGATPADPLKMGLSIVGGDSLSIGDYVVTEYGPGIIFKTSRNTAGVELFGLKKMMINRGRIAKPSKTGLPTLTKIISDPALWRSESDFAKDVLITMLSVDKDASLSPNKVKLVGNKTTKPSSKLDDEDDMPKLKSSDGKLDEADIEVYMVNSIPALVIADDIPFLEDRGWKKIAPFISVSFSTWDILIKTIEAMEKKFYIAPVNKIKLMEDIEKLRTGRSLKLTKPIRQSDIRQFFIEDQKRLSLYRGNVQVDPYVAAIDTTVKLVFSKKTHDASVIQWIKRFATKNAGKIKGTTENEGFYIKFFPILADSMIEVRALAKIYDIDEQGVKDQLLEIKEAIKELRGPKQRPM
jgi:hypothetical protein